MACFSDLNFWYCATAISGPGLSIMQDLKASHSLLIRAFQKNVLPETIVFQVFQISYVINCNCLWLNSYQCSTVMTLSYTANSLVKMTWLFMTIHDYSWLVNFEFLIDFDYKSLTKPKGHCPGQLYRPKEWRKMAMIARNYVHISWLLGFTWSLPQVVNRLLIFFIDRFEASSTLLKCDADAAHIQVLLNISTYPIKQLKFESRI